MHLKSVLNNTISGTDFLKSKCFNPENLEVNLFDFYNQTGDSVGMPNLGVQPPFNYLSWQSNVTSKFLRLCSVLP